MSDTRRRDLAKIHLARKALGLDEVAYRAILAGIMARHGLDGEPSAARLDARARADLLGTLRRMGWQPAPPTGTPARRPEPARYHGAGAPGEAGHLTQRQADYIAALERRLGWDTDPRRLAGFIERQVGRKTFVSALTNREASRVITGLERLAGLKPHPRSRKRT